MSVQAPRLLPSWSGPALVAGLLALALWDPPWSATPQPLDLILLWDDSLSMAQTERAQQWNNLVALIDALPRDSRVALVRFGAEPTLEVPLTKLSRAGVTAALRSPAPPRTRAVDPSTTNLANAISLGSQLLSGERPSAMVLVSDGLQTDSDATSVLNRLRDSDVVVYFDPDAHQPLRERMARLTLDTPALGRINRPQPLFATVTDHRFEQARLSISANGNLIASQNLSLHPGQHRAITLDWTPRRAGSYLVTATLEAGQGSATMSTADAVAVHVEGPPAILYVASPASAPPLWSTLRDLGARIRRVTPQAFAGMSEWHQHTDAIVLDDLDIGDLSEQTWERVNRTVREDGSGLLVLGGANSFGAGGYRRSTLEDILPVTAQSTEPEPTTAVVFLLDKSGSMDTAQGGATPLAQARAAILATSRMLAPHDLVGLVAFDVTPTVLLPPLAHEQQRSALPDALSIRANGGTDLMPGIRAGVEQLRSTDANQRLLVVVTDGFLPDGDYTPLEQQLREEHIALVALAVGRDTDLNALRELAQATQGSVLRVDDVAQLPAIMRESVNAHRAMAVTGPILPQPAATPPFLRPAPDDWPVLDGYMVTRPRRDAEVYLRAPAGHPLFASHFAGAGRVAVMPGGLSDWASAWPRWSAWERFSDGLMRWLAGTGYNQRLHVSTVDQPGRLNITVDATDSRTDWRSKAKQANVWIRGPGGWTHKAELQTTAPGRFEASIALNHPGRHELIVRIDELSTRDVVYHNPMSELQPDVHSSEARDQWLRQELLTPLPKDGNITTTTVRDEGLRPMFLSAALILQLTWLAHERGQLSRLARAIAAIGKREYRTHE